MIIYSSLASPATTPQLDARGRSALLIDADNLAFVAGGKPAPTDVLADRLDQVLELSGRVHYRLVAAQRHHLERYGDVLAARNLRWLEVPDGPDEADRALALTGLELVLRGYSRLVVASGDHFYAPLAHVCDLQIALPRGLQVSHRLRSVATVLTSSASALAPSPCVHSLPIRPTAA